MISPRVRAGLRDGVRSTWWSPVNGLGVLFTLALASGASQAVWTAWNQVVELPLPFAEPDQLVELRPMPTTFAGPPAPPVIYGREVSFLAREASSFSQLGAVEFDRQMLGEGDEARRVRVGTVDRGVLEMLGIAPAAGRLFLREDHDAARDGATVAVLCHPLARQLFANPADAVDSEIELDGRRIRVVGVMPPRFWFPRFGCELWLPAADREALAEFGTFRLRGMEAAYARLREGVTPEQAAAEATTLIGRAGLPASLERGTARVMIRRLQEGISELYRAELELVRFGLLLLAVVAVIGVTVLRSSMLRRRLGTVRVRRALGASIRDEALSALGRVLVLGPVAGVLGTLLAVGLAPLWRPALLLVARAPEAEYGWSVVGGGVLIAIAAAAVAEVVGLLTLIPKQRGRRLSLARPATLSASLVTLAVACCTLLMVGTALLATSAFRVFRGDRSYPGENLAHVRVSFDGYGDMGAPVHVATQTLDLLVERLHGMPGVELAGYADALPGGIGGSLMMIEGLWDWTPGDTSPPPMMFLRRMSPTLLATLRLPVVEGRGLLPADAVPAERVMVADGAAARLLGSTDVVGRFVASEDPMSRMPGSGSEAGRGDGEDGDGGRIVGVFPEVDAGRTAPFEQGALYAHYSQPGIGFSMGGMRMAEVAVRFREAPDDEAFALLRRVPGEISPDLRVLSVETAQQRRAQQLGPGLLVPIAVGIFGVAGIILSAVGIFAQIANEIARRRREFALRTALGAPRRAVRVEAARRTAVAAGLGAALGLGAAWPLARVLAAATPWVEIADPWLYVIPAVVSLAIALAGCAAGSYFVPGGRLDPAPARALATS